MYENMCLEIYFQCLDSNFEKREKKGRFLFLDFSYKENKVAILQSRKFFSAFILIENTC